MLTQIIGQIDGLKKELRELSDALWNNPETAYCGYKNHKGKEKE